MTATPDLVRKAITELIAQCKEQVLAGDTDATEIGRGVQMYCEMLAALPREEARKYTPDLESLMQEVTQFGEALKEARAAVLAEIEALGTHKKAFMAYYKSDTMAGPKPKRKEEEE